MPAAQRLSAVLLALLGGALAFLAGPAAASSPPPGAIRHIFVIDLENEDFDTSFGPQSPARYLNEVLVPEGVLLNNYYATGHASTDNYIAQVSGQAPNQVSGSDCISDTKTFIGTFSDVTPGTLDPDQSTYPGQADGAGCVYPPSVKTIADQLTRSTRPTGARMSPSGGSTRRTWGTRPRAMAATRTRWAAPTAGIRLSAEPT